ncbi:MAG: archaeosortase/exosortase family protein [Methylovulum sp.]|nr:archaeosortase/exosortase family protein [Methylovulum sp.]
MKLKNYIIRLLVCFLLGMPIMELLQSNGAVKQFCLYLAAFIFAIVHTFDPSVTLASAVLRHGSDGFALEVAEACSALPQVWLLISGLLAFPATFKSRLTLIVIGFFAVQMVNVIRLTLLLYLGEFLQTDTFNFIHEQFLQWAFSFSVLLLFFALSQKLVFPTHKTLRT